jgi:hypothetical protein
MNPILPNSSKKALDAGPMTGLAALAVKIPRRFAGCCARAASGHAAADPATPEMKSRRRMRPLNSSEPYHINRRVYAVVCRDKIGRRMSEVGLGRVKTLGRRH